MHLPRDIGLPLAHAYMRLEFRRAEGQRMVVARNLGRVLGHPPESPIVQTATRECFALYGRYWYETFALRTMSREEVFARHRIRGVEHIERGVQEGRGVIMVLPHMGNWDAAGHWLCLNGHRMTAVAEELKPRGVFELFFRHRRALGMNIVALGTRDAGRVGPTLVRLLAENQVVTLVADRDLTGRGVEVEMFGAPRKLPAGPAYLALATGVPISVCSVVTTAEGWYTKIDPWLDVERTGDMRADVTALTRRIAAGFERFISEAPADWHMFQPAWPEDEAAAAGTSLRPDV